MSGSEKPSWKQGPKSTLASLFEARDRGPGDGVAGSGACRIRFWGGDETSPSMLPYEVFKVTPTRVSVPRIGAGVTVRHEADLA
jgi:hypothetical protein